ncbi:MAG: T9SS type A sorting domain-containing protein [candidate division KSB1 bacterium]|jgi:hypothetical protein|nr:T9SS type A sorting domain-containing protein [candidate division KSB1 bacterium]
MKKLLLTIIVLFTSPMAAAQNFHVVVEDSLGEGVPSEEIALGGHIINLTANELNILITRVTNDIPAGWTTSLCLDVCAAPWINELLGTIPPNDSLEFSIHFFPDDVPATGEAQLDFNIPRDTVIVSQLFRAKTLTTGVTSGGTTSAESFRLLGNHPNPFNESTIITFRSHVEMASAELTVYSLTGRLLLRQKIDNIMAGEHQVRVEPDGLPSGTYLYRLRFDAADNDMYTDCGKFMLLK